MIEFLRCPECEEAEPVNHTAPNSEKKITVYASYCDVCETGLYHIEGEGAEKFSLSDGLRAEPCDFDESELLI